MPARVVGVSYLTCLVIIHPVVNMAWPVRSQLLDLVARGQLASSGYTHLSRHPSLEPSVPRSTRGGRVSDSRTRQGLAAPAAPAGYAAPAGHAAHAGHDPAGFAAVQDGDAGRLLLRQVNANMGVNVSYTLSTYLSCKYFPFFVSLSLSLSHPLTHLLEKSPLTINQIQQAWNLFSGSDGRFRRSPFIYLPIHDDRMELLFLLLY